MYNPILSQNILVGKRGDIINQICFRSKIMGSRLYNSAVLRLPGNKAFKPFVFIDLFSDSFGSLRQ